jgi:hypothetical protein
MIFTTSLPVSPLNDGAATYRASVALSHPLSISPRLGEVLPLS